MHYNRTTALTADAVMETVFMRQPGFAQQKKLKENFRAINYSFAVDKKKKNSQVLGDQGWYHGDIGGGGEISAYLEPNEDKIADQGNLVLPLEMEDYRDICMIGLAWTATFSILSIQAVVAQ